MNYKSQMMWKAAVRFIPCYYAGIYLEALRQTMKNLDQVSRVPEGIRSETKTPEHYRYAILPYSLIKVFRRFGKTDYAHLRRPR
jgi:hypothetical protein